MEFGMLVIGLKENVVSIDELAQRKKLKGKHPKGRGFIYAKEAEWLGR